jgi:hypothetical protein
MTKSDGWSEYNKLVMDKLSSHDKKFEDMVALVKEQGENFNNLRVDLKSDVAGIKVSLENIRKNETCTDKNTADIVTLKTEVSALTVKSGVWGAAGGILGFVLLMVGIWTQSGIENVAAAFKK